MNKSRAKMSSRTDSKFNGPLYTTFYQKHSDAISAAIVRDNKKISRNSISIGKYRLNNKGGSIFSNK